ncbi:hypothetical protein DESPIG_01370 [Desulfovibrio piger ATCC 29098]|uniref:Uncharacterized protein n=1 Tax=Desulfovibrio piger ATCC 29098 TaxID=411464 RepID=B6WTG4_9BACT|nr:hypothetical protein DESPIG_01370 [Desulfovibrio piger ATCC 29098]
MRGRESLFLTEKRGSLPLAPSFPKNRSQDCLHRRQSFFVAVATGAGCPHSGLNAPVSI